MKTRTAHTLASVYEREHFVQLYKEEASLFANLTKFIGGGLREGDACAVIATQEHINQLEELLVQSGFNLAAVKKQNKLLCVDATTTLNQFMVNGLPDKERFKSTITELMLGLATDGKPVRAFGEMVALLWLEDNQTGAVLLEQLWNEIANYHDFTLYCAYPQHYFSGQAHTSALTQISNLHSSVITPLPA